MEAQKTDRIVPNVVPALPSLDELRGTSREGILHCLDIIGRLGQRGIRPPAGYLFALSKEVMRLNAQVGQRGA